MTIDTEKERRNTAPFFLRNYQLTELFLKEGDGMLILRILYYVLLLAVTVSIMFFFDKTFLWGMRSLEVFFTDDETPWTSFFACAGCLSFVIFVFFALTGFQTAEPILWFLFGYSCFEWLMAFVTWVVQHFWMVGLRYAFDGDFVFILPVALGTHALFFFLVLLQL